MEAMAAYAKALVLGLLEGITEFLPVSSTGHLILGGDLLHFTGDTAKAFEIIIQLGAILAVVWLYRERLLRVALAWPHDPASRRFILNLVIAFIPSGVMGLALYSLIKRYLFSPLTVAMALIVGGAAILVIERVVKAPRIRSVDEMRWQDALKVGCCQVLAMFPGTSRSGATIMGGLVFGLSRQAATEFSFFLAIPTMFAATGYDLLKNIHELHQHDLLMIAIGFVAAFFSAVLAVKAFIRFVGTHSFAAFAWYRIVFGAIALAYFWH